MPILHDYIEQTDGGSRLCLMLAQGLNAPLICGFVKKNHPFLQHYSVNVRELCTSTYKLPLSAPLKIFLQIPLLRQYLIAQLFLQGTGGLAQQQYAIYSGSYAPLAIRNEGARKNILYCHTPPRFLYDQQDVFAHMAPRPLRPLLHAFCRWLRPQYEAAAHSMDVVIANSAAVQERIQRYLQLPASIVYPPCDVQKYTFDASQGYFLSMVRLDKLKRIHLLVDAFRNLPQEQLVISSTGPEEKALKSMAADMSNVTFTGVLSEERRRQLLAQCRATLCVAESEDFGMCAVESLAAGKPVIIAKAGGLQEIVSHEETGLCVSASPSVDAIRAALVRMDNNTALHMRRACEERAACFDTKKFIERMRSFTE